MSDWWLYGFVIGVVVVVVATVLILLVTGLARKVAGEIDELNAALAGASRKTRALQKLSTTSHHVTRITLGLAAARRGPS